MHIDPSEELYCRRFEGIFYRGVRQMWLHINKKRQIYRRNEEYREHLPCNSAEQSPVHPHGLCPLVYLSSAEAQLSAKEILRDTRLQLNYSKLRITAKVPIFGHTLHISVSRWKGYLANVIAVVTHSLFHLKSLGVVVKRSEPSAESLTAKQNKPIWPHAFKNGGN